MDTYRIAHFTHSSLDKEFVVILSPGEQAADYLDDGWLLGPILEIIGDAHIFPCDRELRSE